MKCPVCDVPLSISSREGVEIDFCPQCRGVWLDRGELDKVIERASAVMATAVPARDFERGYDDDRRGHDDRRRYDDRRDYDERRRYDDDDPRRYGKKRKKRGFLEDLFEFD
jgi:uncharacterized protein